MQSTQSLSEILAGIPTRFHSPHRRRRRKPITYRVNERGCFICTSHSSTSGNSYPQLWAWLEGVGWRRERIGRLVYMDLIGPIPEGHVLRHKCDEPRCINPAHLETGTHADNMRDMDERGRRPVGEKVVTSKLTEAAVAEIRTHPEVSSQILAERYGVKTKAITEARRGRQWKSVPVPVVARTSRTGIRGVQPQGKGFAVRLWTGETNRYFGTYPTLAEAEEVAQREYARLGRVAK